MNAMLGTLTFLSFFLANDTEGKFEDDFSFINSYDWTVVESRGPGQTDNHRGTFAESNATVVDGYLRLELNQAKTADGEFVSTGAELMTIREFGYGTYEFRMRASTTSDTPTGAGEAVSGSVSAAFVYAEDATTEIDVEFEGNENHAATHLLSWIGESRDNQHTQLALGGVPPHDQFYVYKFVWLADSVTFYRDGVQIARHETIVPATAGKMIFNHWGTHSKWWGGWATPETPRYAYVDWFRFTPLEE
jgi:beta-glucanase (GH16 family)